MAKWRETTSTECQTDFDDLLDVCIEIAAERLSENWGLDPVAVVNDTAGGRRVVVTPQPGDDAVSEPAVSETSTRDLLVDSLRSASDDVRSYAIVSDVTGGDTPGHRFEVLLEHREYAMQILVPYEMPDDRTFNLGPMRAAAGSRLLWG